MIAKRTKADPPEPRMIPALREDHHADVRHRLSNSLQLVLALIAKESANARTPEVKAALERLAVAVQQLTALQESAEEVEVGH